MNKEKQIAQELDISAIDAELVADYLRANPDFFAHYPNVLQRLNLKHQQDGSVSLIERQQRVLREKITALEDEITALMSQAQRNEKNLSWLQRALLSAI